MISPSKMEAGRKAGWSYFHSEALDLDCAVRNTPYGPELYTEDKVHYLPAELKIIAGSDGKGEITKALHTVKRLFDGEIIPER